VPGPDRFRTRGQSAAVEAVSAMLRSGMPHAVLLVGPPGVGKTTLARDIAAALLCRGEPTDRPCGTCRACRSVAHGNHPDLHGLAPGGPGALIPIGGRDEPGVRDLTRDLALLPVEGGARVAIIEAAHRMTEDAQSAFLKTLEEPPLGTVLILCADDEEQLLPTIRSRCVRVRLGPLPTRDVEQVLVEAGVADAAIAARMSRLASGRPGVAMALAAAPEAVRIRGEISRTLVDLATASRTERITGIRDLSSRAGAMLRALAAGSSLDAGVPPRARRRGTRAAAAARMGAGEGSGEPAFAGESSPGESSPGESSGDSGPSRTRLPAAERRAAALALVAIWRDLVRDVAVASLGEPGSVHDPDLLEELEAAGRRISPSRAAEQLQRLDVAGEQLDGNVSPELVLDVLAIGWAA
jgi:DNA polymerase III delta' subunit